VSLIIAIAGGTLLIAGAVALALYLAYRDGRDRR
jgi:hypothetical protein